MGLNDTYNPAFQIIANDKDITEKIADRLMSLKVTDAVGLESDTLEITLADHDDDKPLSLPVKGAELQVSVGYGEDLKRLGMFVCDEVELSGFPMHMVIRARAAVFEETPKGKTDYQTQKTRTWKKGTTLGAMVSKIAQEHGMQPAIDSKLGAIALPHINQTEESDISFLIRVSKNYDAVCKPAGGKLILAKRGQGKTIGGIDLPAMTIDISEVRSFSFIQNSRDNPGTVVAFWHSTNKGKRQEVSVGKGEPVRKLRHTHPTQAAAQAAAQAEFDKKGRHGHRINMFVVGNPDFQAEAPLTLTGFRSYINGDYTITRVEHQIGTGTGYECHIEAEIKGESVEAEV